MLQSQLNAVTDKRAVFPSLCPQGILSCMVSILSCFNTAGFNDCHGKVSTKVEDELNQVCLSRAALETRRTVCLEDQGSDPAAVQRNFTLEYLDGSHYISFSFLM